MNDNDETYARDAGGLADEAVGLVDTGGARNVPFGLAIDSIGRSTATHAIPVSVWQSLRDFEDGSNSWFESCSAHAVHRDEALAVMRQDWNPLNPPATVRTVGSSLAWIVNYGQHPFYQPLVERLSFFVNDLAAGEFDPSVQLEPQMFLTDMFSQLFTESFDFHFQYLATLDQLYYEHRPSGPVGTFNETASNSPYHNQYMYWRDQIETTYLLGTTPQVTLPPHLAAGHWTIGDVLDEIVTMMAPDGQNLHPDLPLTAKGVLYAKMGSSLGMKGSSDGAYKDAEGFERFYTPQFQVFTTGSGSYQIPGANVLLLSTGDTAITLDVLGGSPPYTSSTSGSTVQMSRRFKTIESAAFWSSRGVTVIDDLVTHSGLGLSILPFASGDLSALMQRGFSLNLVDLIRLGRRIGRSMDQDVQGLLLPAMGQVTTVDQLFLPTQGLNSHNYDTLYNLYVSEYSFNENPIRKFTAAHMGPIHETVDVTIGDNRVTTSGDTVYERYWMPGRLTQSEALTTVSYYFPGSTNDITAIGPMTLRELSAANMLNTNLISRAFSTNGSMHTKVEKPVILPAGVTGAAGLYASGEDLNTSTQLLEELYLSAWGSEPHFGLGHQGWTDWMAVDPVGGDYLPHSDVSLAGSSAVRVGEVYFLCPSLNEDTNVGILTALETEADIPWDIAGDIKDVAYTPDDGLISAVSHASAIGGYYMYNEEGVQTMGTGNLPPYTFQLVTVQGSAGVMYTPVVTKGFWGTNTNGNLKIHLGASGNSTWTIAPSGSDVYTWNGLGIRVRVSPKSVNINGKIQSLGPMVDYYSPGTRNPELWAWIKTPGSAGLSSGRPYGLYSDNYAQSGFSGSEFHAMQWNTGSNPATTSQGGSGSQGWAGGGRNALQIPTISTASAIIGAYNIMVGRGDLKGVTVGTMDVLGFGYQYIEVAVNSDMYVSCGAGAVAEKATINNVSGGSATENYMTTYRLCWRVKTPQEEGLFKSESDQTGISYNVTAAWTRMGVNGETIPTLLMPKTEWEWVIVCMDSDNAATTTSIKVETPTTGTAKTYFLRWIHPGDTRADGWQSDSPNAHPELPGLTLVAGGVTGLLTDTKDLDDKGVGNYQEQTLVYNIQNTASSAYSQWRVPGLRDWYVGDLATNQSGARISPYYTEHLAAYSSGYNLVIATINPTRVMKGAQAYNLALFGGGLAYFGRGRQTPVFIIPDRPEKRKPYRPHRHIVDAAVRKEQKQFLVATHERLDPEGGPFGIPFYSGAQPFMMQAIVLDANLPDQYILEGDIAKTRMVDRSNRGMLTFDKVMMIEVDEGGQLRGVIANENHNAGFVGRADRYRQNVGGQDVYTTDVIRHIQLGKQYQRLGGP